MDETPDFFKPRPNELSAGSDRVSDAALERLAAGLTPWYVVVVQRVFGVGLLVAGLGGGWMLVERHRRAAAALSAVCLVPLGLLILLGKSTRRATLEQLREGRDQDDANRRRGPGRDQPG